MIWKRADDQVVCGENGWGVLIPPPQSSQDYSPSLTATELCWSFQTCWAWQRVNRGSVPSSWDCRVSEGGTLTLLSRFSSVMKGEEVVKAWFHRKWEWFWDWVDLWFYICKYTHYKYLFFKSLFLTFTFKESVWIAVWFWIDIFFFLCNITSVVSAQWHLDMLQNGHKVAHSLSHIGVIKIFFFYFILKEIVLFAVG